MCLLPACHQPATQELDIEPAARAACQPPAFAVAGFVAEEPSAAGFVARGDPELFAAREVPEAVLVAARGAEGFAAEGSAGAVFAAVALVVEGFAAEGFAGAVFAAVALVVGALVSRPMGLPIIVATRLARESRLVNPRSDSWS